MAATNLGCTWRKNLFGDKAPFKFPVQFQAGSTQAVKSGEILDLTTITAAIPLAADEAMSGIIAVAECEIAVGDLAGFHMAIVPRPGDIFEYSLLAAAAPALGAPLYWSTSQQVKTTGTHALGYSMDTSIIPIQGFQSVAPSPDATTTTRSVGSILMGFDKTASYWSALNI